MFIYNRKREEPQNYFFQVDKIIEEDYLYFTKVFKNVSFWILMSISVFTLIFIDKFEPLKVILYSVLIGFAFYILQFLFFVQLPYMFQQNKTKKEDIELTQKNIKKLTKLKEEKQKDYNNSNDEFKLYKIQQDLKKIDYFLKQETEHLEHIKTIQENKNINKYKDIYNKQKKEKIIKYYLYIKNKILSSKNKEYDFLKPLKNSLYKLTITLDKNPTDIQLIQDEMLIYLEELKSLIIKFEQLTHKNKYNYSKKINYVSNCITAYIDDFGRKIDKYNTNEIDVSVNVLLKELEQYQEKAKEIEENNKNNEHNKELVTPKKKVIEQSQICTIYDKCKGKYVRYQTYPHKYNINRIKQHR